MRWRSCSKMATQRCSPLVLSAQDTQGRTAIARAQAFKGSPTHGAVEALLRGWLLAQDSDWKREDARSRRDADRRLAAWTRARSHATSVSKASGGGGGGGGGGLSLVAMLKAAKGGGGGGGGAGSDPKAGATTTDQQEVQELRLLLGVGAGAVASVRAVVRPARRARKALTAS